MKVVILAGGFGTRLGNLTQDIPKPMVKICGYPIILHIINHFYNFGCREFIICLGYKQEIIKEYFMNMNFYSKNIQVSENQISILEDNKNFLFPGADFQLIDTGLNTMTGKRLLKIKKFMNKEESFFLTYGDGISTINLNELYKFHRSHNGIATVTSVHPIARFGEVISNENGLVNSFKEKPAVQKSWINGGYFVFENDIFDFINEFDNEMLEQLPLEKLVAQRKLYTYKFDGYWRCMDTPRDLKNIIEDVKSGIYKYALLNDK